MNKFYFYLYIFLWVIYGLQGSLYAHGNYISVGALALVMVMSLYYFVYAIIHYKLPKPLKILSLLIAIWTLYGLEPILFGTGQTAFFIQPFSYLKNIYMSLLPIFVFYVFSMKGFITEDRLRWLFVLFLIIAIFNFYDYQASALTAFEGEREEVTNNAGYVVVSLLPLLPVFWRRPILQYILLGVCLLFALMGMKRGAIVSGFLCSIWMILVSFRQDKYERSGKRGGHNFIRLLATIAIVGAFVYVVQYLLSTSDYFSQRVSSTIEGDYSGRESIYGTYFTWFINQTDVIRLLFGNGADATLRYFTNYAHNDWLEILIDNGVIVALVYGAYWISMIVMLLKGKRGSTAMLMFGCFVIIYLLKTFFSMSYNSVTVYAACAIGYAFANFQSRRSNVKSEITTSTHN